MRSDPDPAAAAGQQPRPAPTGPLGRDLPIAIVSGVALAVVFLVTLFVHPYAFLTFVAVLLVVALLELDVALREQGLRPATPVAIGVGLLLLYGTYAAGSSAQALGLVLLVLGTLAWVLLDLGPRSASGPRRPKAAANTGATFLITIWVPFLASFLGLLLARPDGAWYVFAVVALAVANDIGAFGWGSRFGRRKLAPSVSPAKTWEGFAGGLATALVLAGIAGALGLPGFDLVAALVVAAGIGVAGTVGDLTESLVKRDLGVKDLGRIIPGHGGIMDRVDAIVFALPVAHLLLVALGR